MHYIIKIYLVLILLQNSIYAQTNYSDYSEYEKQLIFFDDFKNAENDWSIGTYGDGCRKTKIKNGYFKIESLCDNQFPYFWTNLVNIDETKDFEIEANIMFVYGEDSNSNSLVWGDGMIDGTKFSYRYRFGISGNGKYMIDKYSGSWEYIKNWTKSSNINKGQYNKLTIRKIKDNNYYFINNQFVHKSIFESFYGQRIGFQSSQNATIRIDYISVSYLSKEKKNLPPVIVILKPEINRAIKIQSKDKIRIVGKAIDEDGIYEVIINNTQAQLQNNGNFSVYLPLLIGENTVSIKATDMRMKSSYKKIKIHRESTFSIKDKKIFEKRLALVIGNSNYEHALNLINPTNDAKEIKLSLKTLGFQVNKFENCTQKIMKKAIDEFGKKLKNYDVGLFFYAGHGVQVKGINYLIPVDADLVNENDVEYDTVRADRVLAKMEYAGSKTNIVILDACRENPFGRSWHRGTKSKGLALMNAPSGSIIAYATSPGDTASDGNNNNGLYTSAILKHIQTPNITIEQMFKRVRSTIMDRSGKKQIPWESTSLRGNFYFKIK